METYERKTSEIIATRGNYDTRKGNNRAPNLVIPLAVLDQIENNGITSEQIDGLGAPVYRYKTQITIHGQFPSLSERPNGAGYIGGYKSLVRNDNGSLGIRYNAVDYAKKEKIYAALKHSRWGIERNSAEWRAELCGEWRNKAQAAELQADIDALKARKETIDTGLFFGNVQIALYRNPFLGMVQAALELQIGAIYESNVDLLILNLTGKSAEIIQVEIDAEIAKREQKARERQVEIDAEIAKREQKARERQVEIDAEFTNAGLVKRVLSIPTKSIGHTYIVYCQRDKYIPSAGMCYRVRLLFKAGNSLQSVKFDFDKLDAAIEFYRAGNFDRTSAEKFKTRQDTVCGWQLPKLAQPTKARVTAAKQTEQGAEIDTDETKTRLNDGAIITIRENKKLDGIELEFAIKPSGYIIAALKTNGFHWHFAKKIWYAKQSAARWAFAKSLLA